MNGRTKTERGEVSTAKGLTRTKLQSGLFHTFKLRPSYDHYSVHGVAITFEQVETLGEGSV